MNTCWMPYGKVKDSLSKVFYKAEPLRAFKQAGLQLTMRVSRARLWPLLWMAALVVFCAGGVAWGQTQPQAAAAQTTGLQNPTQPEAQPSLKVDRDPVLSPDIEDNQPVSTSIPLSSVRVRQIQRMQGGIFTMRQNVDEVVLNCTVVDSRGRMTNDLSRNDFKVWEDGVPQEISFFQHADVPVSVGILVDNSGSMSNKLSAVREAALDLVKASNPQDEAFIVNFSDEAYLDQGFTSDISKMEQALSNVDARGGTALYDAVVAAADEMAKHAKHSKQVLLIITDGEDDASTLTQQQAIRRVQSLHGPEIYSIGLLYDDSGNERKTAEKTLEALSNDTGGVAYFPRSLRNVDEISEEVAQEIRNQYSIGYHPTKPFSQGGYRTVRVEGSAPGHGTLTVRTRAGYYATVAAAHKANVHKP